MVPAANTLCEIAAAPCVAVLLEWVFLGCRSDVWTFATIAAACGLVLIALDFFKHLHQMQT